MTKPTCPRCHAPAYVGFTAVECPTVGCVNYSEKEASARQNPFADVKITFDWAEAQVSDYARLRGRCTLR